MLRLQLVELPTTADCGATIPAYCKVEKAKTPDCIGSDGSFWAHNLGGNFRCHSGHLAGWVDVYCEQRANREEEEGSYRLL